jgi:cytoskeletal protein CcmA (bactofilin family)
MKQWWLWMAAVVVLLFICYAYLLAEEPTTVEAEPVAEVEEVESIADTAEEQAAPAETEESTGHKTRITVDGKPLALSSSKRLTADQNGNYVVAEDVTLEKPLYLMANSLVINGRVDADVWTGGSELEVVGEVTDDFNAMAQKISIQGQVGDDAKAFAQMVRVHGSVGGTMHAFCGEFLLSDDAVIGGDLTTYCGQSSIGGTVMGDLQSGCQMHDQRGVVHGKAKIEAETVSLEGVIHGPVSIDASRKVYIAGECRQDVVIDCDRIEFEPTATILGNLTYTSSK